MGLLRGYKQLLAHRSARRQMDDLSKRAYKRAQDRSPRFIGIVPKSGGALLWKLPSHAPRRYISQYYVDSGKGWRQIGFNHGMSIEHDITAIDWAEHASDRYMQRRWWYLALAVNLLLALGVWLWNPGSFFR